MTPFSSSTQTNPRLALIAIAAVFAILNLDITTVNVALVTLGKDLHADLEDLQWGLNSYMLAFAALIALVVWGLGVSGGLGALSRRPGAAARCGWPMPCLPASSRTWPAMRFW